jgi:hypothetical protein
MAGIGMGETCRIAAAAIALLASFAGGARADALKVTSDAFEDGGLMAARYAGHMILKRGETVRSDCGGENISPPLAWTNVPAGVKSFALIIFDPDGAKGSGVAHWVAYGIAGDRTGLPENFGVAGSPDYIGGTSSSGNHEYNGPCPVPGHTNHYVFSIYALDLDRTALKPGLTRDELIAAMKGHVLDVGSIIGRSPSRLRSGP